MAAPGRLFASHRLWRALLPRRTSTSHKYAHGHALVLGGGMASPQAPRAWPRAPRCAGAGLVTVVCPKEALAVYAAQLTAVMVAPFAEDQVRADLADPRRNGMLLGPGAGVGEILRRQVLRSVEAKKACVLDADALTSFQERPQALFDALAGAPCVLTPHDGEYARLFAHARATA